MGESNTQLGESIASDDSRPRAMIHKKVLDVARSNPDASLGEIADDVSGASDKFVERVLEQYGDPANTGAEVKRADGHGSRDDRESETADSTQDMKENPESERLDERRRGQSDINTEAGKSDVSRSAGGPTEEGEGVTLNSAQLVSEDEPDEPPVTDPDELTDKQRETLRAVDRNPTATQADIADALGVTRATISKRVNDIPGFDWSDRRDFVSRLFEGQRSEEVDPQESGGDAVSTGSSLESRVASIENRLEQHDSTGDAREIDPSLTHKIIHACVDAEYISEEEELSILRQIIQ